MWSRFSWPNSQLRDAQDNRYQRGVHSENEEKHTQMVEKINDERMLKILMKQKWGKGIPWFNFEKPVSKILEEVQVKSMRNP